MAGLLSTGEAPEDVADLVARIAQEPQPHFRYQSTATATAMAARKLVDPTGDSVVQATSALLLTTPT